MRKISLLLAFLVLISFAGGILAQEIELPDPGLTPDNPFYFLEIIVEGIGNFFTFGDLKKAERYAKLAAERIAEAKAVVEKGRPEAAERALRRYEDQLGKALARAERAKVKGERIEKVVEIVAEATSKHFAVLENVLEKVPEAAKPAISRALEKSKNGHINALKALSKESPERAVEINLESLKGRLKKAKEEGLKKDRIGLEKALKDFEDFQNVLEEIRGKVHLVKISEQRVKDIEDLDEIEDEAEGISLETKNKVKEIKNLMTERLKSCLKDLVIQDPEKAIEINLKVAEARLRRAKEKAEEGEIEKVEEAVREYENQYKFGEEISEIAKEAGKDITTVEQLVGKATSIHLEVLADVYEKVPEEAKEAIEKAMEVSVRGHEKAVESLKKKGALDELPEEVIIPEKVPPEVKEKIKEKVREELEKIEIERPEVEKPKIEKFRP